MPFVAEALRGVELPPEEAFDRFVDFRRWHEWMPAAFRPISGPDRALREGDRVRAVLDTGRVRLPIAFRVMRVRPGREIAWGGGPRALLQAEHRFLFEASGAGATEIRSAETWRGALAEVGPLARRIQKQAERVGAAQLDGFATWVARG
jgi:hypothetical protein